MPSDLAPDSFARLDHRAPELGFPTAVLWARQDILGGRTGVRQLGFIDLGTATGRVEVPEITTIVADMRSEDQVNLLYTPRTASPGEEPPVMAEAHFEDPHASWWSEAAHNEGRLVVLTSVRGIKDYSSTRGFLMTCWAAVVPLATYAFDTGTGTRRPSPS